MFVIGKNEGCYLLVHRHEQFSLSEWKHMLDSLKELHITAIALTPIKYECDIKHVNNLFCDSETRKGETGIFSFNILYPTQMCVVFSWNRFIATIYDFFKKRNLHFKNKVQMSIFVVSKYIIYYQVVQKCCAKRSKIYHNFPIYLNHCRIYASAHRELTNKFTQRANQFFPWCEYHFNWVIVFNCNLTLSGMQMKYDVSHLFIRCGLLSKWDMVCSHT